MKKIISLGIASAVLALTAVSASAAIAPVVVDTPVEGSTLKVVITTDEAVTDCEFSVSVEGGSITQDDVAVLTQTGAIVIATVRADGTVGVAASAGTGTFAPGAEIVTLVYTVTGAEGDDFSVTLAGDGVSADGFTASIEKGDGTQTPGQSGTGTQTPGDKDNPETGIALAVVPAVLAGAAVVVAKKRK